MTDEELKSIEQTTALLVENGFVIKENALVGRVDGDNLLLAGAAYLLLIQGNR